VNAELAAIAVGTVRGSFRHVTLSTIVFAVVIAYVAAEGAGAMAYAAVGAMYALLVAYNVGRIRVARRALAGDLAALRAFAGGQKRSHVARGRAFLVVAPIIVAVGWVDAVRSRASHELIAMGAVTAFLAWGWMMWWNGLKRWRSYPPRQRP
jgi:hypothetical protein